MPDYSGLHHEPNAQRIIEGLGRLRAQLNAEIPPKALESALLLGTWNIREFDAPSYGPRVPDVFYFIAEMLSRFDLVAVQEVRRDLTALKQLMKRLGWPWRYLVTDTTEGKPGNDERLAFVYDSRKVRFLGLAGELVLPAVESKRGDVTVYTPVTQFARSPYTAAFSAGWTSFQLATVHIIYGKDAAESPERVDEIRQLASVLAQRAEETERVTENLTLLGDFNIFATTDATMQALTDNGWTVPPPLQNIPGSNVPKNKHYDQIAVRPKTHWFEPTGNAGVFDYYKSVMRDEDEAIYVPDMGSAYETDSKGQARTTKGKQTYWHTYWRTFQMSDHLPMWMELRIDYSNEYLAGLRGGPTPTPDPYA